jgi:uncharacterized protein (TIGR00251 family)
MAAPDLEKAVSQKGSEIFLDIEVSTGSRDPGIAGFNEWRGRISVRVRSPPKKGAANREVIELLSTALGLRETDLDIVSGQTSGQKRVTIRNGNLETILNRLEEVIGQ